MTVNEAGKWKRFKQSLKDLNEYMIDHNVYSTVKSGIKKWRNHKQWLGDGINTLADKLEKNIDGSTIPSFVKTLGKTASGAMKVLSGVFKMEEAVLGLVYRTTKAGTTRFVIMNPNDIMSLYTKPESNEIYINYNDDTITPQNLMFKCYPAIESHKDISLIENKQFLGPNHPAVSYFEITKRITEVKCKASNIEIESIKAEYDKTKGGTIITISFKGSLIRPTIIFIPKCEITITQNTKEAIVEDIFYLKLKRMSKKDRGVVKVDDTKFK